MDLIVAIDIIGGQVVRLSKGAYETQRSYGLDPVEVAKAVEGAGLKRLHLVDLDGAKAGRPINVAILQAIAKATNLTIDVGGGIRTSEDLAQVFDSGAAMANLGSVAVQEMELVGAWIEEYTPQRLILAADSHDGMVKSGGWLEASDLGIEAFIDHYLQRGLVNVTATDIARDGMLSGPSYDLYRRLIQNRPSLRLTASGGVSSLEDLSTLATMGLCGAIIGKALYEKRFSILDLGRLQEQLYG